MWEIIKRVTLRYEINATKRSSSIVHLNSIHKKLLLYIHTTLFTKSSGIMHHDTIHSLAHMFLHIKSFLKKITLQPPYFQTCNSFLEMYSK